jgi:NTP pyrophosphatase (non-canonical NTP hydrolase)
MELKQLQKEIDEWIGQFEEGYWGPLSMLARLTEEVGELAREVNHLYGEKTKKKEEQESSLSLELGDILFIIGCFANSLDLDLDQCFKAVMDKYRERDFQRWTRKDSSN